ncbi:hypothetical protein GGR26_002292 [Lewinella marina]|uniref:Endonuclease/exonuclease/phosphatase domain-containing protein n=1 Tax=Neolewinella marina TaxID=438751 RepID=A0A2G0CGC1_9BACT|nr:ExeM/NucH family extracellular endonuclease [Neolewinella marina]NJB86524.1 hypothetical protein [Neolewinella marina]PHK99022.1 hypothetical protein CGL56_06050 [Neolewinella marina]
MRIFLLLLSVLGGTLSLYSQRVILTGIMDGDAPGGLPKAIELFVEGTVNLGDYTLVRYANGGTSGTDISLNGTFTDRYVYVVSDLASFEATFGTGGDFADPIRNGNVSGNGDDVFALQQGATIVDVTGGTIGVRENLYQDGFLYRLDNTGPSPTFDLSEWAGGNKVLDGLNNAEMGAATPFGTYRAGAAGPQVTVTAEANLEEPATDGGFSIALSRPATGPVTITYALSGTATTGTDYSDPNGGSVTISSGQNAAAVLLQVIDDTAIEGDETIELTVTGVSDPAYSPGAGATLSIIDEDLFGTILISTVQGAGSSTPLAGETVTVEAVVTGSFPGGSGEGLRGFYIQEEDKDNDSDPATSEGLFVFADNASVSVGDLVKITGRAAEFSGQTQLTNASITVLESGLPLPVAINLTLPLSEAELEALEGMRVTPLDLVVTDNSNLARFGEVTVTSGERLIQFTECNAPDAAALAAYTASQQSDVILVDDGRGGSNVSPVRLPDGSTLSATNTLRAGQTIENLTGILGYGFNNYRIQPTETDQVVLGGNVRPATAPVVGGEVTVVSANVLNYFTTLGGSGRGADNAEEFERQQAKIVNALCALNADIVGLIEIENKNYAALQDLIAALNASCGTQYTYVTSPNTGSDQIMVALIYQADRVAESGTAAALAEPASVFVGPGTNRVPLAQTFRVIDPASENYGQQLTVVVNHFKSKGSGCGDNTGDGSGNCNTVRDAAARAITEWLATNPTGVDEEDILIIGDLNAYRMEDPIQTILEAGYFNTKVAVSDPASFPCGGGAASYGFQGQWGSLDYVLASNSLADALAGAATWGVNSAEPAVLDYNTEGLSDGLYAPDFYRFSDHDPLIVGLDLGPALTDELMEFTAAPSGNKVKLQWVAVPGITAEYFAVERLDATGAFQTIGTVKVSGGNSNANRQYVFNDQGAVSGMNTYRLKLVGTDGMARYSHEASATLLKGKSARATVERVGHRAYRVVAFDASSQYSLIAMSGQVLRRGALQATGGLVSMDGLPAGLYLLHFIQGDGSTQAVKVVVP